MDNPVKNHDTCRCVYWQKTLSFDYESIKCSSTDMSKKCCVGGVCTVVSDGVCVDQCLVGGFLFPTTKSKNLNNKLLEGALCQVTEMYFDNSEKPPYYKSCYKHMEELFGCAIATIVSNQVPQPS